MWITVLYVAQCVLLSVLLLYCYRCGSLYVACCSVYADYSYYTATYVDHCMLHVDWHHPGTQRCWWTGLLLHIATTMIKKNELSVVI